MRKNTREETDLSLFVLRFRSSLSVEWCRKLSSVLVGGCLCTSSLFHQTRSHPPGASQMEVPCFSPLQGPPETETKTERGDKANVGLHPLFWIHRKEWWKMKVLMSSWNCQSKNDVKQVPWCNDGFSLLRWTALRSQRPSEQ